MKLEFFINFIIEYALSAKHKLVRRYARCKLSFETSPRMFSTKTNLGITNGLLNLHSMQPNREHGKTARKCEIDRVSLRMRIVTAFFIIFLIIIKKQWWKIAECASASCAQREFVDYWEIKSVVEYSQHVFRGDFVYAFMLKPVAGFFGVSLLFGRSTMSVLAL